MSVVPLESEDVAWFRDNLVGAREAASRLAARIGMGEHRAGEVALAMSEAASNLVKHAVDGAIVLRIVRTGQHAGIEVLALDSGPGMADVGAAMLDGRHPGHRPGHGRPTRGHLRPALRPRARNRNARPLLAPGRDVAPRGRRRRTAAMRGGRSDPAHQRNTGAGRRPARVRGRLGGPPGRHRGIGARAGRAERGGRRLCPRPGPDRARAGPRCLRGGARGAGDAV
ncbi:ATP-binding protein [Embleya sp. MST-111070]|uniref:ATP-binding protein n=1 Tax=Embleya sp. MST-111070 TaxID=3398231 RepID=UPI003F733561